MKVLVVGSTHYPAAQGPDPKAEAVRTGFASACRDLGGALARAGHEVVVGSDSESTADRFVVEGVLNEGKPARVLVIRPEDEEKQRGTPFAAERKAGGPVTFRDRVLEGPWAAGRVSQILAAEAVVLIGGGLGTAQAGYAAVTLERPVVAIPAFGGSAEEVWKYLKPFYDRLGPADRDELGQLRVAWQPATATLTVRAVKGLAAGGVFRRDPWLPVAAAVAAVVGVLAGWVWSFVHPPSPPAVAYFTLAGLGALLGNGLRHALGVLTGATVAPTRRAVGAEVCAGLILAFALSVVYLTGGLAITGSFDFVTSTSAPAEVQKAGLALTLVGLAAGWLIEPVADRLQGWLLARVPRPV